MSNPLWLECPDMQHLPSPPDIRQAATREQHIVLCFPAFTDKERERIEKRELIKRLSQDFTDFSIFDSGGRAGSECITIMKVVGEEEVIANADWIIKAAERFRAIANSLMNKLAARFDAPIEAFEDRSFRFRLSYDDYQGQLDMGWEFGFHGYECRFSNFLTGQVLEVKLGFETEFGVLDPYFFHQFIRTTPGYERLLSILRDAFHDTNRALDILERHNLLQPIVSPDGRRGTIAHRQVLATPTVSAGSPDR